MFQKKSTALLFTLLTAGLLHAAGVNYNRAPVTDTGWNACSAYAGYNCRTLAYFDAMSLDDQNDSQNISSLYQNAFDAWNATNAMDRQWTLTPGGMLSGTFDVTIAKAEQFDAGNNVVTNNVVKGGLEINIDVSRITLPTLGAGDQLVWTQGLLDNYLGNGTIVPGMSELDIVTGACNGSGPNPYCPPAYPFQYPDNSFYDQPKARYQPPGSTQAFFDANAYLAVENVGMRTIKVYDGISYGFQNYVSPEPGTWILCIAGGFALLIVGRRRATSPAA